MAASEGSEVKVLLVAGVMEVTAGGLAMDVKEGVIAEGPVSSVVTAGIGEVGVKVVAGTETATLANAGGLIELLVLGKEVEGLGVNDSDAIDVKGLDDSFGVVVSVVGGVIAPQLVKKRISVSKPIAKATETIPIGREGLTL